MDYTENQRVMTAIQELKAIKIIRSEKEIADTMKISRSTISEIVNNKRGVSRSFVQNFCYYFSINPNYIKSGIQPILLYNQDGEINIRPSNVPKYNTESKRDLSDNDPKYWQGVPIFDTPVSAGMLSMIRDEAALEPAYYLQIPSFKDCKFGARVTGDSMYPEIRSGDFVILKEVVDFIYGDIYLVVTMDGQETVKRVHPHERDPAQINLVPSNKEMPVTPMLKDNIIKIFKVKGVIKGY